jgi:hypothetical protein
MTTVNRRQSAANKGGVMRGIRRPRWIILVRRAACVGLASLASACSPSAERSPGPTPTSPTLPTPTPPASSARLEMSGRALDQNGTPVPGALVEVDYSPAGGASNPPSHCTSFGFCWLATRTNDRGEYSVEFEPQTWPPGRSCDVQQRTGCRLGFVYSFDEGYEVDVQWVPSGSSPAVRDMRLRATRSIRPGESIVVSVDSTSSLCTDLEDLWVMESRCEIVVIESGAGMLNIEARPAAGGPAPSIFCYTTGNYAGLITRPAPGAVAIPVRGGTYRILVAVPEGAPSQQFNVTTTLR